MFFEPLSFVAMYIPLFVLALSLLITFNTKNKSKTEVTQIFNLYLIITLVSTILITVSIILIDYFKITNIIPQLLMRLYNATTIIYITFVSLYIFSILYLGNTRNKLRFDSHYKSHLIMCFIGIFFTLILPVNIENCEFDGPSTYFVTIFYFLNVILWTYIIIKYRKRVEKDTIKQTIVTVFMCTAIFILIITISNVQIDSIIEYIYAYILYFKMENPDLKYNNELSKNKEETEKALSAKTDFLNSMNEEINDPLKRIVSISDEMYSMKSQVRDESVIDDLESLLPATKGLDEIISNILDINKLENNEIEIENENFNPVTLIQEVLDDEKLRSTKDNIKFEFTHDKSLPTNLYGDKKHITQIIHNLVNNAIKYTDEGKISALLSIEQVDYETYNMKVKISDTGVGIKNETLITLFTNFAKNTDENNSNIAGTGLGLSITKKLVDLLGGTITVESIYGSGSTFTIIIPTKIN